MACWLVQAHAKFCTPIWYSMERSLMKWFYEEYDWVAFGHFWTDFFQTWYDVTRVNDLDLHSRLQESWNLCNQSFLKWHEMCTLSLSHARRHTRARTHIHTHTQTRMHVHTHTRAHTHTHTHSLTFRQTHTYTCTKKEQKHETRIQLLKESCRKL